MLWWSCLAVLEYCVSGHLVTIDRCCFEIDRSAQGALKSCHVLIFLESMLWVDSLVSLASDMSFIFIFKFVAMLFWNEPCVSSIVLCSPALEFNLLQASSSARKRGQPPKAPIADGEVHRRKIRRVRSWVGVYLRVRPKLFLCSRTHALAALALFQSSSPALQCSTVFYAVCTISWHSMTHDIISTYAYYTTSSCKGFSIHWHSRHCHTHSLHLSPRAGPQIATTCLAY